MIYALAGLAAGRDLNPADVEFATYETSRLVGFELDDGLPSHAESALDRP